MLEPDFKQAECGLQRFRLRCMRNLGAQKQLLDKASRCAHDMLDVFLGDLFLEGVPLDAEIGA